MTGTTEDRLHVEAPTDTTPDSDHGVHHGYISDKVKYLARLKRIEGQARGIARMVGEEKYASTSSPK